jgi:6-phosphogluconolactonase (cycloisomerase 2 family)
VFARDAMTGSLTFVEAKFDNTGGVNGLAGAHSVDVSPDGAHVYVAGRYDDAVAVFARNASTGALTFVEVQIDGLGGVDGLLGATSVRVSPDGDHVYGAGLEERKLAVFSRNPASGALTFVEAIDDGMGFESDLDIDDARTLTVSPDGKHLYLANHIEDAADSWVSVFSRNAATGTLTLVTPVVKASDLDGSCFLGIESDSQAAVSPDGSFVYVNHGFESAVAVFSRDAASGRLTFHESLCDESIGEGPDPVNVVDGLWASQGVAVSPDNEHVYVASANLEDAVAVFAACVGATDRDLVLSNDTVTTTENVTACNSITIGPNYDIAASGDVTAQAGVEIVLTNGFSVAAGGRFVARIAAP